MNKKYYFISGLPRAGNTLLSSILNQNPDILATGKSFLPDVFYDLKKIQNHNVDYKIYPNKKGMENIFNNIFKNFFDYSNCKYIIDRGEWIRAFDYSILKQYCPNDVKIVILVRNILDIIKSFLKICLENPNFVYNIKYNNLNLKTTKELELEKKADIIMSEGSYVYEALEGLKWLKQNDLLKNYLIIEYDDLIENTQKQIKKIYDYLDIPHFKHSYKNFKQINGFNDDILGAPIHNIRTNKIKKKQNNLKLTKNIMKKYKNLEVWR